MGLVLLTGGARSGKSELASRAATRWRGAVTFIATAEPLDEEMRAKIARHRAGRPSGWRIMEEPADLSGAIASTPGDHFLVIDCLTLWVSNLLERGLDRAQIEERAAEASKAAAVREAPTVAVTNEVGDGIVPADPATRAFRDLMGTVNATFARSAERALLVVAGRIVPLADPKEVLPDVFDR